jgi:cytochrome b561
MNSDYRVVQKVLHWLMGIFIVLDLFVAQKFGGTMELADRLDSRSDHATLGTTLCVLFVLRIIFRTRHGAPALPTGMSNWQVKLAKVSHIGMYVLLACLFATGILTGTNATDPLTVYGSFDITRGNSEESVFQYVRQFHELCTQSVIAIIVLHVFASVYHHFVLKDDSTVRMLMFWKSQ